MSESTPETFRHTAPVPEAWTQLQRMTSSMIAQRGSTLATAIQLAGEADRLGNEDLEASRYFGLGKLICSVAQRLPDPLVRAPFVRDAASSAATHYRNEYQARHGEIASGGIRWQDINSDGMGWGVAPYIRPFVDGMAPADRLILNTLSHIAFLRRPAPFTTEPLSRMAMSAGYCGAETMRQDLILPTVAKAFFGGALGVTRMAVWARYQTHMHLSGRKVDPNPLLFDMVRTEELEAIVQNPATLKVARSAAALRSDEFTFRSLDYLRPQSDGLLNFDRERMAAEAADILTKPLEADPESGELMAIHKGRLDCPALKIPGLITLGMQLLPDVLWQTNEHVAST